MIDRRVRLAAVLSSGPLLLLVTVAAAWHTPEYSGWRDTVSRLGSAGQPWAPLVRGSFVTYGILVAVGASVLVRGCRDGAIALGALYVFAAAAVVAGLAPKDLPGRRHTAASEVHVYATVVGGCALLLAMVIVARAESSPVRRAVTLGAGALTAIAAVVFRFSWGTAYYGAIERAVLIPGMTWLVIAAAWAWADAPPQLGIGSPL